MINEMIWEVQRVGLAAKAKAKIDCTAAFSMGYALFDDTLREPSEPPGSSLSTLHVVAAMCTSSKRLVSPDDTRFVTDSVYGDLIPLLRRNVTKALSSRTVWSVQPNTRGWMILGQNCKSIIT